MSLLTLKKTLIISAVASSLAMAGCATKNKSQVAVSPLGYNGGNPAYVGDTDGPQYDGGALVNNSQSVLDQANGLQSVVYFGYDSSNIGAKAAGVLDTHASLLAENQGSRILITGHADSRGSREYNMALGERRAQAVKAYLASKGINPASVEVSSRGKEDATGNHAQDRKATLSY